MLNYVAQVIQSHLECAIYVRRDRLKTIGADGLSLKPNGAIDFLTHYLMCIKLFGALHEILPLCNTRGEKQLVVTCPQTERNVFQIFYQMCFIFRGLEGHF